MQRYRLAIQYNGSVFRGAAAQKDRSIITVQSRMEEILQQAIGGRRLPQVALSSRTDAGVHALYNTCHVDITKRNRKTGLGEDPYPPFVLQKVLCHQLQNDPHLSILDVKAVPFTFDARKSAIGRTYIYRISSPPLGYSHFGNSYARMTTPFLGEREYSWWIPKVLDIEKMRKGASYLLGAHDFSAFRGSHCQAMTPFTTVTDIHISESPSLFHPLRPDLQSLRDGNNSANKSQGLLWAELYQPRVITVRISARRFLYHMVRNIVGTLYEVGIGKRDPEEVEELLAKKDRSTAGATAPPQGLFLAHVHYPDDEDLMRLTIKQDPPQKRAALP